LPAAHFDRNKLPAISGDRTLGRHSLQRSNQRMTAGNR
jgi:hypothetical protein